MKRLSATLASLALLAAIAATPASADFGLSGMELGFSASDASPATEAGTHPFAMDTTFSVNEKEVEGKDFVDGALKDLEITFPPGFAGNPTAVPRCETLDFLTLIAQIPQCSDSTALGLLRVTVAGGLGIKAEETVPVYNLRPSPGIAQKLGFTIQEVPITVNAFAAPTPPYNITAQLANTTQVLEVFSSTTTLWGNPADPAHDDERGKCGYEFIPGTCPANIPVEPYLTLPRSCDGSLTTIFEATSWWTGEPDFPGPPSSFEGSAETTGMSNCAALGFAPTMEAGPTTDQAESPTGLEVEFTIEDEGLANPQGTTHSDIHKAVVTLPEGITANPSLAEGLTACSPAELDRETVSSSPGQGCPQASKVGTVEAETPILEGTILKGALFLATPDDPATSSPGAENPFDSLLALYVVLKDPVLGVIIKQAGKIEPDPVTGQLVTTFDDLPPYPVSSLRVRLREGGRSPLISPPTCGPYTVKAELTPSGDPANPLTTTSEFRIDKGVAGAPCPTGRPFAPGFEAGTFNNDAGAHSPFYMRLTRRDGDQDLTRFDAELPPGVVAKLAGVEQCTDASIAAAKAKRGRQEIASPSCPAGSKIGNVFGGAGVGSQLTYVPGSLYLAGPFGGGPLSVVGIVPAVAGPFDVGTVVVRQALKVDPRSGEVRVDGANSDPIPHILAGIPLRVRDIRVHVDRQNFTLNPTSCNPFATAAQIWGGGQNLFSKADDSPVAASSRFQASNCSRLGFKPRLALQLKGGTKRGGHPALTGTFKPRAGDANLAGMVLRLPRSAFLDQAHIRTICTRVQYAANGGNGGGCPAASIYGRAKVFTPILAEPLQGPVYLRSSDNNLPDFVASLHGLVDVEAVARIDSQRGGIRATFEDVPDAPLSKVVVQMQGAKKGLIVNSTDLCAAKHRANAQLSAQNAKRRSIKPVVGASCGKGQRGQRARRG